MHISILSSNFALLIIETVRVTAHMSLMIWNMFQSFISQLVMYLVIFFKRFMYVGDIPNLGSNSIVIHHQGF